MESEIPLKNDPGSKRIKSNSYAKETTWKRIRKYFRDYCDSSSIIGFKYLGERRSRGERILWAVLIILATFISIYYIMEIYYKYEENPFMVTLATRESPIYTIPFPAVTICPVAKTESSDFNYTKTVHKIWDNETLTEEEKQNAQYMSLLCELDDTEFNDFFSPNETFDAEDFFDTISYLKHLDDDTFLVCAFMGRYFDCKDLFVPIIVDEGICYSFNMLNRHDIFRDNVEHYSTYHNSGNESNWSVEEGYSVGAGKDVYPRRGLLSGADNALEIFMIQNIQDTDYLCMNDAQGYSVQIHTPYSIPRMKKQYFTLPLDYTTQVIVKPHLMTTSSEVKNYKIKDRQCFFTDERNLKFFKIYSPENCKMECLANYTLQKCGCVNYYLPRDNSTPICGNGKMKCMEHSEKSQKEEELERMWSGQNNSSEGCNCMPLCTALSYDTETSRTAWFWKQEFSANRLEERLGLDNFSKSSHLSRLVVFFHSDQFIPSQRNELYGFFDFLSNFGGLLGLFTGFSLLSAVEIVYFISVRLWCNERIYHDFAGAPGD